jgi:hypothetical protein
LLIFFFSFFFSAAFSDSCFQLRFQRIRGGPVVRKYVQEKGKKEKKKDSIKELMLQPLTKRFV